MKYSKKEFSFEKPNTPLLRQSFIFRVGFTHFKRSAEIGLNTFSP